MAQQDRRVSFRYSTVRLIRDAPLGTGAYGQVCKATLDELPCAAKCLHPILVDPNNPRNRTRFEHECRYLSEIRHPNIVQYLCVAQDGDTGLPVLLMELMDDSLTHFLEQSKEPLAYHVQVNISHDIALAVAFLHLNNIVHRDLSSNNVLLIGDGSRAKVTDFGMSKLTELNPRMTGLTKCPGTPAYMAPEALLEPPVYTEKLDCFQAGVLMIQIITRKFPDPGPAMNRVRDVRYPTGWTNAPVPEVQRRQNHLSLIPQVHPLLPLAVSCLNDMDSRRPSAQQICQNLSTLKATPQYIQSLGRRGEELQKREGLVQQLKQENEERSEEVREMKGNIREMEKRIRVMEGSIQDLQGELQQKEKEIREKDGDIKTLQGQVQQQEREIMAKEGELRDKERDARKEREIEVLQYQLQQKEREVGEMARDHMEQVTELQHIRAQLQNELVYLREQQVTILRENAQLRNSYQPEKYTQLLTDYKILLVCSEELKKSLTEESAIAKRAQLELKSMKQKCDAWREEVEKLATLKDEVAQLREENMMLHHKAGQATEDATGLGKQLQELSIGRGTQGVLERKAAEYDQLMERVTEPQQIQAQLENELISFHEEQATILKENVQLQESYEQEKYTPLPTNYNSLSTHNMDFQRSLMKESARPECAEEANHLQQQLHKATSEKSLQSIHESISSLSSEGTHLESSTRAVELQLGVQRHQEEAVQSSENVANLQKELSNSENYTKSGVGGLVYPPSNTSVESSFHSHQHYQLSCSGYHKEDERGMATATVLPSSEADNHCQVQFMWQPLTEMKYSKVTLLASCEPGSIDLTLDPEGSHYYSPQMPILRGTYEGQLVVGDAFIHPVKEFTVENEGGIVVLEYDIKKGKAENSDSGRGVMSPPKPQLELPTSPAANPRYRSAAQQNLQLPTTNPEPLPPTGYMVMDLFHPYNTFCLLPSIDVAGRPIVARRPIVASTKLFTEISLRGRGSFAQECVFTAEPTPAPWVISLKVPNRGRVMVDSNKQVSLQHLPYKPGNPAFEFVVRPYGSTRVTFESRKFVGCFLSVDQSGAVSVRYLSPDSEEVQFAVRVQRFNGPYTTRIMCAFGRDSIVNQLKDRCVIQLYSKETMVYLALADGGAVVGMTDSEHKNTHLVYCDRGLGRVSLKSHKTDLLKLKMTFIGELTGLGAEDLNSDFYLKENVDGTVVFESVPNKGRFVTIPYGNQLLRNLSVILLEFTPMQGNQGVILTKYHLN